MATLEELEGVDWGEPTYDSHLVTTCHRLRRKQLDDYSVEDLRIMVGQGIGLRYLVPRALDILEGEPFVSGDLYPGDLLSALLGDQSWPELEPFRARVETLARKALAALQAADGQIVEPSLAKKLTDEINLYLNRPMAQRPRQGKGD